MKYPLRLFVVVFLALAWYGNTNAQNGDGVTFIGPLGVYISCGSAIGNDEHPSHGVVGYKIERKQQGEADFKIIAELSTPPTKGDLERAFASALNDVPYPTPLENISIQKIWEKLDRFHEIDSLPLRGSTLALRLALGVMYLDRDVKEGSSYEYKVTVLKEKGQEQPGESHKITFKQYAAPGEVYHRLPVYSDSSSAHLFWHKSDNTEPTSIVCFRKTQFGSFSKIGIRPASTRKKDSLFYTIVDTTLSSDVVYSYYLQPIDYFGNAGPSSDTITIHTLNAKQIKLPDHIRAEVNANRSSVKLSWMFSDTVHAIGIRIYRGEENGNKFSKIGECSSTKKFYVDASVVPDRTYLYYLTTLTAKGDESGPTAKVFAVSESNRRPNAPFALSASAQKDGVHLKWYSQEPYLRGFYVYRGEGFHATLKRISGIIPYDSVATYIDTEQSLSPKSIYSYSVLALSTSNIEGYLSDTARVQPHGVNIPPSPFNVDALVVGKTVKLFWDEMRSSDPLVVGYIVYRREQGKDDFEKLGSKDLSSVNNNYTDSLVKPGVTYEYYVRTIDSYSGLSENTISVSAMVSSETNVSDLPVPIGLRGEVSDDGISISWGEILGGDIAGYKIYRTEGDSDPKEITTVSSDKSNYTDNSVKKDVEYIYTLTSIDQKKNESLKSKELRVRNK